MKLRQNPLTGRLAERLPAWAPVYDGKAWFMYDFAERGDDTNGLTVELLTPEQVAGWPEVLVTPKPDADLEYAFALACSTCPPHGVLTRQDERERVAAIHDADHDIMRYAYRLSHPDWAPGRPPPHWPPATKVTFRGSREGDAAGLVDAVVLDEVDMLDADGDPVHGFVVNVDGRQLFMQPTALARSQTGDPDVAP